MLSTRFTDLFGLEHPLMNAPMSNHSGGRLAAAVSVAGGLGTFGATNNFGLEWFKEQVAFVRAHTDRPFGVGFITQLMAADTSNFKAALELKVPVFIFSFADPRRWVMQAQDAGATTICQVQSAAAARLAVDAGADVLLAQGNEAGGHTGEMNLLPLLCDLVERYPNVPVLAAGGITSGRALAAVLAAGAAGASLGTVMLATPEAVEVPEPFKDQVLKSSGEDTAYTRLYDLLGEEPWPAGIAGRVYRNRLVREWDGRNGDVLEHREELVSDVAAARGRQDPELSSVYMGQGVGNVREIRPAGDVVWSMCEDAEAVLRNIDVVVEQEGNG